LAYDIVNIVRFSSVRGTFLETKPARVYNVEDLFRLIHYFWLHSHSDTVVLGYFGIGYQTLPFPFKQGVIDV